MKTGGVEDEIFSAPETHPWRQFFKQLPSNFKIEEDLSKLPQFLKLIQLLKKNDAAKAYIQQLLNKASTESHSTAYSSLGHAGAYNDMGNTDKGIKLFGLGKYGLVPLLPEMAGVATHVVCCLGKPRDGLKEVESSRQYIFRAFSKGCALLKLSFEPHQEEFNKIDLLLNQEDKNQDAIIYHNKKFFEVDRKNKKIKELTIQKNLLPEIEAFFNSLWEDSYKEATASRLKLVTAVLGRAPSQKDLKAGVFKQFAAQFIKSLRAHSFNLFKTNMQDMPGLVQSIEEMYNKAIDDIELGFKNLANHYLKNEEVFELVVNQHYVPQSLTKLREKGIIDETFIDAIPLLSENELTNLYSAGVQACLLKKDCDTNLTDLDFTVQDAIKLKPYQRDLLDNRTLYSYLRTQEGLEMKAILAFNETEAENLLIFSHLLTTKKMELSAVKVYQFPNNSSQEKSNLRLKVIQKLIVSGDLSFEQAKNLTEQQRELIYTYAESLQQQAKPLDKFLTLNTLQVKILKTETIEALIKSGLDIDAVLNLSFDLTTDHESILKHPVIQRLILNKKLDITQALQLSKDSRELLYSVLEDPLVLDIVEEQGKDLSFILSLTNKQGSLLKSMTFQRLVILGKINLDLIKEAKLSYWNIGYFDYVTTELMLHDKLTFEEVLNLSTEHFNALHHQDLYELLELSGKTLKDFLAFPSEKAAVFVPGLERLVKNNIIDLEAAFTLGRNELANINNKTVDLILEKQLTFKETIKLSARHFYALNTQNLYDVLKSSNKTFRDFLTLRERDIKLLMMGKTQQLLKYKVLSFNEILRFDEADINNIFLFEKIKRRHPKLAEWMTQNEYLRLTNNQQNYLKDPLLLDMIDKGIINKNFWMLNDVRLSYFKNSNLKEVLSKLGKEVGYSMELTDAECKLLLSSPVLEGIKNITDTTILNEIIDAMDKKQLPWALKKYYSRFELYSAGIKELLDNNKITEEEVLNLTVEAKANAVRYCSVILANSNANSSISTVELLSLNLHNSELKILPQLL